VKHRLLSACLALALAAVSAHAQLREASPEERAQDLAAFAGVERSLAQGLADIESVVVVRGGRVVYEFYRDGQRERLRDVQSVEKSALSALVGSALGEGRIASLDQPVLELVPEWRAVNADPRAAAITLRHLLTMTAGFEVRSGAKFPPAVAWARPLAAAPGEKFVYDNALIPVVAAVVEKASGMPLADYARKQLVQPLQMAEPGYGSTLHLRTIDLAKLGQLFLRNGNWGGQQLVPADYVAAATRPQNARGPPVSMPYGYMWWVLPTEAPRRTFMASGWGGQLSWVYPPLDLVIAMTSATTPASQERGQAVRLLRNELFAAASAVRSASPGTSP
jgi:CubicO group peptidase (beta-lactamase class C family)